MKKLFENFVTGGVSAQSPMTPRSDAPAPVVFNHTPFTKLRELDDTALLVILYYINNFINNNFNNFLLKIIDKINNKYLFSK